MDIYQQKAITICNYDERSLSLFLQQYAFFTESLIEISKN